MHIRDATIEDAQYIAQHLRAADALELQRIGTDASAVVGSFEASDVARTIEHEGRPVAVFGRAPVSFTEGGALIWLLATDELDSIQRGFVLACKPELQKLMAGMRQLMNMTHRENAVCLRWLRWLGFQMSPQPCGPGGEFIHFWLESKDAPHV